jgi:hypothetical protein
MAFMTPFILSEHIDSITPPMIQKAYNIPTLSGKGIKIGIISAFEYKNIIDEIIKGIEKKDGIVVNYEQFDHMLWYYFKGSKTKVQKAMNVLPDIKFD